MQLTSPAEVTLSKDEILRYSRHLIMPEVGMEGQLKLKKAKVLLVGAGGLGAPLGLYLAAAGIGRIGLVDFDVVDFTNLQRQVIHGTKDVGRKKLDSAFESMRDINPFVQLDRHETALSSENALDIFKDYDIVVDGTDNFPTRYLVNDACVLLNKPNVYGSIFRFEGQATVFAYEGGPCYRCLYPEPPPPGLVPSCAEGGVLGILPGMIGLIQATETVKLILGIGEPLVGRLLLYDALGMKFRELKLRQESGMPGLRRSSDHHETDRLPAVLRHPASGSARRSRSLRRRYRTDGSESEARSRRQVRADRRARAARISDLPDSRLEADSAGRTAEAAGRTRSGRRDRGALQERHAQREGRRSPEAGRLQECAQHEGRHSGLERQGRPQRPEILIRRTSALPTSPGAVRGSDRSSTLLSLLKTIVGRSVGIESRPRAAASACSDRRCARRRSRRR